jgi:putative ABC transport system permease protein
MIVNGLVVGVAAALAGAVLGFAAWFAYVPTLQQATGHVVDAANLPWWAFAIGVVFAIATSVLASRRPAKTMAQVPVVAALSGRPAPPKAVHRSALPGVIVFAAGLACLAFADGLAGVDGGSPGHAPFLLAGLVATIVGVVLLAPLFISVLAAGAGPRLPVAIRIALRDLVRYRARSGAALAATTFAVFLAMAICLVASIKFDNPLDWIGPNLSSSQLIFYTQQSPAPGQMTQLSNAQAARLGGQVDSLAVGLTRGPRCRWSPRAGCTRWARRHTVRPISPAPCTWPPRSCSPRTGSRPARSLPAPTSSPCGQGWRACRTWRCSGAPQVRALAHAWATPPTPVLTAVRPAR